MEAPQSHVAPNQAVIIGGSIAGMCAAAAISRSFEHVIVLERDRISAQSTTRRGVPQAPFVHSLLERGRREIEALFPGFSRELILAGVPVLDFGSQVIALRSNGWITPGRINLLSLWPSRYLLEQTIRRLLKSQYPNVDFCDAAECIGLEFTTDRTKVGGVSVRRDGASFSIRGELTIDASGQGSRVTSWLEHAGLGTTTEVRIDPKCGYSARLYEMPERLPSSWWWNGIVIECAPPDVRVGGVLLPIEGGRWLATLMGFNQDYPPGTESEFISFARRLRSPLLAEALEFANPISDIFATRSFVNRLRRCERQQHWPTGLVLVGDSVCSFNPIYSQGMTIAACGARLLSQTIEQTGPVDPLLAPTFHAAQAEFLALPWKLATSADLLFPETVGHPHRRPQLSDLYMESVLQAAWERPRLHRKVARVLHMLAPARTLYGPSALWNSAVYQMKSLLSGPKSKGTFLSPPAEPTERGVDPRLRALLESDVEHQHHFNRKDLRKSGAPHKNA